ncbi:hypothetical protein O1611_g4173 [Lasiodiplodia mahajangana]|uniref:Uncharacterized protein n=1 Tax=Lasiodiplodia mahajangana TaxID=1108764 RepID=A0ACC2JPM1_9PEZI|nr:hypothetical protein O1611_g4173 [Lasiodiplodia mahajangana]
MFNLHSPHPLALVAFVIGLGLLASWANEIRERFSSLSWSSLLPSSAGIDWTTLWIDTFRLYIIPVASLVFQSLFGFINSFGYYIVQSVKYVVWAWSDNYNWWPDAKIEERNRILAEQAAERLKKRMPYELACRLREENKQKWDAELRRREQEDNQPRSGTTWRVDRPRQGVDYRLSQIIPDPLCARGPDGALQRVQQHLAEAQRERERAQEWDEYCASHRLVKYVQEREAYIPPDVFRTPEGTLRHPIDAQMKLDELNTMRSSYMEAARADFNNSRSMRDSVSPQVPVGNTETAVVPFQPAASFNAPSQPVVPFHPAPCFSVPSMPVVPFRPAHRFSRPYLPMVPSQDIQQVPEQPKFITSTSPKFSVVNLPMLSKLAEKANTKVQFVTTADTQMDIDYEEQPSKPTCNAVALAVALAKPVYESTVKPVNDDPANYQEDDPMDGTSPMLDDIIDRLSNLHILPSFGESITSPRHPLAWISGKRAIAPLPSRVLLAPIPAFFPAPHFTATGILGRLPLPSFSMASPTGFPAKYATSLPTGFSAAAIPTGYSTGFSNRPSTGFPARFSTGSPAGFSAGSSTGSPNRPSTGFATGISPSPSVPTGISPGVSTGISTGAATGAPTGSATGSATGFHNRSPTGFPTGISNGVSTGISTGISTTSAVARPTNPSLPTAGVKPRITYKIPIIPGLSDPPPPTMSSLRETTRTIPGLTHVPSATAPTPTNTVQTTAVLPASKAVAPVMTPSQIAPVMKPSQIIPIMTYPQSAPAPIPPASTPATSTSASKPVLTTTAVTQSTPTKPIYKSPYAPKNPSCLRTPVRPWESTGFRTAAGPRVSPTTTSDSPTGLVAIVPVPKDFTMPTSDDPTDFPANTAAPAVPTASGFTFSAPSTNPSTVPAVQVVPQATSFTFSAASEKPPAFPAVPSAPQTSAFTFSAPSMNPTTASVVPSAPKTSAFTFSAAFTNPSTIPAAPTVPQATPFTFSGPTGVPPNVSTATVPTAPVFSFNNSTPQAGWTFQIPTIPTATATLPTLSFPDFTPQLSQKQPGERPLTRAQKKARKEVRKRAPKKPQARSQVPDQAPDSPMSDLTDLTDYDTDELEEELDRLWGRQHHSERQNKQRRRGRRHSSPVPNYTDDPEYNRQLDIELFGSEYYTSSSELTSESGSSYDEDELINEWNAIDEPMGDAGDAPQQFSEADKADLDRVLWGDKPPPASQSRSNVPYSQWTKNAKDELDDELMGTFDPEALFAEMREYERSRDMGIGHVPGPAPTYADDPMDIAKSGADVNPRPNKRR